MLLETDIDQMLSDLNSFNMTSHNPIFHNVMVGFLHVFSLKSISESLIEKTKHIYLTEEMVIKKLDEKHRLHAWWNPDYIEKFADMERFFHKNKEKFRLELEGFEVEWPNSTYFHQVCPVTKARPFLTIYPELEIAILTFQVSINECTADDIIFVRSAFIHSAKTEMFLKDAPSCISPVPVKEIHSIRDEVCKPYIQKIIQTFTTHPIEQNIVVSTMIEIRKIVDTDGQVMEGEFYEKYPNHIYGLLAGDSGYPFVPKDVASKRTLESWHSREFFNIFSFDHTVLMFNFTSSELFQKYARFHHKRSALYNIENSRDSVVNPPDIAGLNNGPLIVLENVSILRYLLNIALPELNVYEGNNRYFFVKRDKLNSILSNLNLAGIAEVGNLESMVKDSMGVLKDSEKIRTTLDELERSLTMNYTKRMNILLIFFGLIPLIITDKVLSYIMEHWSWSLEKVIITKGILLIGFLMIATIITWSFFTREGSPGSLVKLIGTRFLSYFYQFNKQAKNIIHSIKNGSVLLKTAYICLILLIVSLLILALSHLKTNLL
ncbi:hypothetical protein [Neobacillus sp. Marseille-QA0830]